MNPEDLARQRFKPLQGVHEKVARLSAELQETRGQVERLKTEQADAAQRDKQAYADALSKGQPRPTKREGANARVALEDCELKAEALNLALDAAFDERARLMNRTVPAGGGSRCGSLPKPRIAIRTPLASWNLRGMRSAVKRR